MATPPVLEMSVGMTLSRSGHGRLRCVHQPWRWASPMQKRRPALRRGSSFAC